ncbi:MAG TPA: helix-turn-helix transcriptional regulator [Rhodocyclaceae bacterium]|nr:helix-turn-helix transcriptional regulator [Rhodocyclaceae bacterium]
MSNPKPTTPDDVPKIGQKLAAARRAKGLSQEAVATELGIDRIGVSNWERDINLPAMAAFYRLCELLEISMDALMSRADHTSDQVLDALGAPKVFISHSASDSGVVRAQISGLLSPLGLGISAWNVGEDGIDIKVSATKAPAEERRGLAVVETAADDRNDRPLAKYGFVKKDKPKTPKTIVRKGNQ